MNTIFTRTAAVLLTALALAHPAAAAGLPFTDVSEKAWYYDAVSAIYDRGLINGKDETTFAPDDSLTLAQTVKLAAMTHQLLQTGRTDPDAFVAAEGKNWYDGYVAYGLKNGIVTPDDKGFGAPATRAQVAVFFSRAIVSSGVKIDEINDVPFGTLPDVDRTQWYAGAVYRLVRWGILSGNEKGELRPLAGIRRSEICAILLRIFEEEERVSLHGVPAVPDKPADPDTSAPAGTPAIASLPLYEGGHDKTSFTGLTGTAGEFTVQDGVSTTDAACALDLLNHVVLEPDNLSFRLYKDSGYEALGIVRGWLNDAARGQNGTAIRPTEDVFQTVNGLFCLWINDRRVPVSELWYAEYDDYTTYAFYFTEKIDLSRVTDVRFACGRPDRETLENASMEDMADRLEEAAREEVVLPDPKPDTSDNPGADNYRAAVADAKSHAAEILFEYENDRCDILYGRGLYGRESSEYRLLFIFRDGTTQTVSSQKVDNIRVNEAGNVLYYNLTGPDGKLLQYGINFED